ncbi:hypothetical protein AgCh_034880 [Apium graveolens]
MFNVVYHFSGLQAVKMRPDENLKLLHYVLYGNRMKAISQVHLLKRNIGLFSGFVWYANEEKQRIKVKERIDKELILKQLRCCEFLQVVRISRSGYPTRITHQEFTERYGILSKFDISQDPLSASVSVLQQFGIQPEMYEVGYTRLYFRAGQVSSVYK